MPDIIKEIFKRQDEILSNIDRESIVVYLFLKNEYAKSDGGNNAVFQFVFRSYYGLDGAGLSGKFKKRFFKLLEQKENNDPYTKECAQYKMSAEKNEHRSNCKKRSW